MRGGEAGSGQRRLGAARKDGLTRGSLVLLVAKETDMCSIA